MAGVVGERDGRDLQCAEQAAEGDGRQPSGAPAAPTASGRRAVVRVARVRRAARCAAAAARPTVPTVPTATAATQARLRGERGGQEGDQRRAGHEHDLVGDALGRERGVPFAGDRRAGGPSGLRTMVPIWGIAAPASAAPDVGPRQSPSPRRSRRSSGPLAQREGDRVDVQHPALAEPVRQPSVRDREDRVADDVGRRHLAGQAVGPARGVLTSSTMPSVIIEIGSRATSAVAEKASAPGRA